MSDIATIIQTWRVLIVEDAPDNAELVERVLKHFGAQVVTSTPEEFREFVRKEIETSGAVVRAAGLKVE